ncbi:MAG TPA: hypothetical protein PK078_10800 [Anaerolineales bacterium]|nr:hypothetical protein [Anaerolineales bacterium]HNB34985.1 hypothetical protein [Anaerolineales bacterium]HNC09254.1 hypothetical protein [Anaerolineales bacterium]
MKSQYRILFGFGALLLAVSLACGGSAAPTAVPTSIPTAIPLPTNPPPPTEEAQQQTQDQGQQGTSDMVLFTDENGLFSFELPGDWLYDHGTGDNYYYDRFSSPNQLGFVENIVYNDGTAFVKSQKGQFALNLLNNLYSATGQVGDIKVTGDQLQNDGSERLEWESKSGGYSGLSFFETRGDDNATFLMLTTWWDNGVDQATYDTIMNAISTYRIP